MQTGAAGQEKAQNETKLFNNSTIYLKSLHCIRKNSSRKPTSSSIQSYMHKNPQNSSIMTGKKKKQNIFPILEMKNTKCYCFLFNSL